MRNLIKLLALLPVLTLCACGTEDGGADQPVLPAALGEERVVGYGETIEVGGLSLEFTTLAEDSRCPLNATCVWEGNARILVTATRGKAVGVLALNTAAHLYPNGGTFEGYRIELRHLAPYPPRTGQQAETYEATLLVDHAAP